VFWATTYVTSILNHVFECVQFVKAKWLLYVPPNLAESGLEFCIYGFYIILSVMSDYLLKL
jgi:hypothetical protein